MKQGSVPGRKLARKTHLTGWWGKWAAGQLGQLRDPSTLCALLSVAVLSLHAPLWRGQMLVREKEVGPKRVYVALSLSYIGPKHVFADFSSLYYLITTCHSVLDDDPNKMLAEFYNRLDDHLCSPGQIIGQRSSDDKSMIKRNDNVLLIYHRLGSCRKWGRINIPQRELEVIRFFFSIR